MMNVGDAIDVIATAACNDCITKAQASALLDLHRGGAFVPGQLVDYALTITGDRASTHGSWLLAQS